LGQRLKNIEQQVRNFVSKNPKLTILIILVLIALYTFISIEALHFTSDPGFCQKCHPEQKTGPLSEVYTWKKSAHAAAGVKCLDCHGDVGFIGYMKAKMGGLYDVYGEFLKSPEHKMEILKMGVEPKHAAKIAPSKTCLFCHSDEYNKKIRGETLIMSPIVSFRKLDSVKNPDFRKEAKLNDILTEPVKADIEPKHKSHLDKGLDCTDCHIGIAHGGQLRNKTKMQTCFDCHDKMKPKKAPDNNNCMACHKTQDSLIPKEIITFGKGDSAVKFAHETHTAMLKCKTCHAKAFPMRKGATKIIFADHGKNKVCFSCHNGKKAFSYTECNSCHAKIATPKDINYKIADAAPVNFSHEFHTSVFECTKCHANIWPMKKGTKKMTMDAMYEGKFCGVCHNEKDAFASTDCDKCHIEAKKK
jgi:c(7)-type cytochrome triheme protein